MHTTALIVEYNPFHNGHQYHLNQSKKITKANNLIVIMSGNFSQRGEPTLLDKWARTKQALSCGADLVLELPLAYNIRSAEYFAHYSILSLTKSKIVDSVVFGSEAGDIEIISAIAHAFINESPEFKNNLQNYLKKGINFPTARRKALLSAYQSYKHLQNFSKAKIKKTLKEPNNILGIEYLKSILSLNSNLKPKTIKRIGSAYHSQEIQKNYASASLIRNLFKTLPQAKALQKTQNLMPLKSWQILNNEVKKGRFVQQSKYKKILAKTVDQIRRLNSSDLKKYQGINNGLENRFLEKAQAEFKERSFLENLKSKNITESKIKRKILQIYFELKTDKLNLIADSAPQYLRVLGIKKGKGNLLSQLQNKSELEIIINPAAKINAIDLNVKKALDLSLSYDLLASDLYALLYQNPKHSQAQRDFYQKLIKI